MDTKQRLRLPQPKTGHHDQLVELAAVLSAEADARQTTTIDLTQPYDVSSTILPSRRRQTHRGWRVGGAVVLAFAAGAVAVLATSVFHQASPATPPASPAVATAPAVLNTPAAWGEAAHARLSAGGRPVSVFGCMGAYDVDAPASSGMLPIAYQGTPAYAEYMSACVSDMSGHSITPNEVAH